MPDVVVCLPLRKPIERLTSIREDPPLSELTAPQDDGEHQPISTSQYASDETVLLKHRP